MGGLVLMILWGPSYVGVLLLKSCSGERRYPFITFSPGIGIWEEVAVVERGLVVNFYSSQESWAITRSRFG